MTSIARDMEQHPKVTLDWALRSLERALEQLQDGWAERRVRRQFHQLLLAIERDAMHSDDLRREGTAAEARRLAQETIGTL